MPKKLEIIIHLCCDCPFLRDQQTLKGITWYCGLSLAKSGTDIGLYNPHSDSSIGCPLEEANQS